MIMDLQTIFSSAQAITATAISTNVLDLRQAATPTTADEGLVGQDLWLVVQVIQAFNTLTSLTITLESDSAVGLATTPAVHFSSGAILLAALTAGATVVRVQVPSGNYQRYAGLRYTVGGSNPTLGTVTAFFTNGLQRNITYPNGFAVS